MTEQDCLSLIESNKRRYIDWTEASQNFIQKKRTENFESLGDPSDLPSVPRFEMERLSKSSVPIPAAYRKDKKSFLTATIQIFIRLVEDLYDGQYHIGRFEESMVNIRVMRILEGSEHGWFGLNLKVDGNTIGIECYYLGLEPWIYEDITTLHASEIYKKCFEKRKEWLGISFVPNGGTIFQLLIFSVVTAGIPLVIALFYCLCRRPFLKKKIIRSVHLYHGTFLVTHEPYRSLADIDEYSQQIHRDFLNHMLECVEKTITGLTMSAGD